MWTGGTERETVAGPYSYPYFVFNACSRLCTNTRSTRSNKLWTINEAVFNRTGKLNSRFITRVGGHQSTAAVFFPGTRLKHKENLFTLSKYNYRLFSVLCTHVSVTYFTWPANKSFLILQNNSCNHINYCTQRRHYNKNIYTYKCRCFFRIWII